MSNATTKNTTDSGNLEEDLPPQTEMETSEIDDGARSQAGEGSGVKITSSEILATPLDIKGNVTKAGTESKKEAVTAKERPVALVLENLKRPTLHRSNSLRECKRKRSESTENLEEEDPLTEIAKIKKEMIDGLWDAKTKMSKDVIFDIARAIDRIGNIAQEVLMRNSYLEGQIDLLKELGKNPKPSAKEAKKDYARVLKEENPRVIKERFMTVVSMKDRKGDSDSETVKKKLIDCMNPAKD